jgi:hypothetical protein
MAPHSPWPCALPVPMMKDSPMLLWPVCVCGGGEVGRWMEVLRKTKEGLVVVVQPA